MSSVPARPEQLRAVVLRPIPAMRLESSLPRLETLLSRYTGIVHALHPVLVGADEARLAKAVATPTTARLATSATDVPLEETTGGYATSTATARAAALGEAAERYAGAFLPDTELVLGSADEYPAAAVDPIRFALFAPEQHACPDFAFSRFERTTRIRWAHGFRIPDGSHALLPSQLVYLPWRRLAPDEAAIGYSTSSGLACGATLEEAVLAGLFEAIERDAFMLTWNARLSLPQLEWTDDPELGRLHERYFARTAAHCALVDLSVFLGVPTVLAAVEGDGVRQPALAIGAGCAAGVRRAASKALAEAHAVRSWGRSLLLEGSKPPSAAAVTTFRDHIAAYTRRPQADAAAFLTASDVRRPVDDVSPLPGETPLDQIAAVTKLLSTQDLSAYAVDVTTSDVAAAGLSVAKVIGPELCQLDVLDSARFLGGNRLRNLPAELGLRERPLLWEDINPAPHPFP